MKIAIPIIIAIVCLQPVAGGEPEPLRERVDVRRVRAPVLLEERAPGGCERLSAAEIEILEDGSATKVLRLEPGALRAVHAILIDAGPRMLGAIREARRAALAYVGSLPAEEAALLATFDQRLILHSSLSTDRERFARDLEWIESGGGSHLWEATRQLIEYLRSRPERKVLLLITDGCDSASPGERSALKVIEQAARTDSLVVFPIGMNVPDRCEGSDSDPDQLLKALAEQTGGQYLRPDSPAQLGAIFDSVRARMEREQYVTYEPLPFGAGPKDKPAKRSFRWRNLKLRSAKNDECRVLLAGSPFRYESASRDPYGAMPGPPEPEGGGSFVLDEAGKNLRGRLRDIVRESGPIVLSLDLLLGLQKESSKDDRPELTKQRDVVAPVPPFEAVVRPDAGPHDPIRQALAGGPRRDPGDDAGGWSDIPFLVNGRTLLDVRRSLALGLWRQPDYRNWAFERVRAERLEAMDELIASAATDAEKETLGQARSYLAEKEWEPEPAELEMQLGAWLGDIPVARAFNAAELWVAQSFIAAVRERGAGHAAAAAADADRQWKMFSTWFPEPKDTRLIGLLVPGYDPAQEAVGFYRVILTPPISASIHQSLVGASLDTFLGAGGEESARTSEGSLYHYLQSFNYSRQAPLGSHLLRWMLEQKGAGAALVERFDVVDVRYVHPTLRDLLPTLQNAELIERPRREDLYLARLVTVVLETRDEAGRRVAINAYMRRDPESGAFSPEPLCLVPPARPPAFEAGRRLWEALVAAKSRSPLPCIFQARPAE